MAAFGSFDKKHPSLLNLTFLCYSIVKLQNIKSVFTQRTYKKDVFVEQLGCLLLIKASILHPLIFAQKQSKLLEETFPMHILHVSIISSDTKKIIKEMFFGDEILILIISYLTLMDDWKSQWLIRPGLSQQSKG